MPRVNRSLELFVRDVLCSSNVSKEDIVFSITILLLKTLQKQAEYSWHLSNLVSFIRLNLFVKIDLEKWLDKPFLDDDEIEKLVFQLSLF